MKILNREEAIKAMVDGKKVEYANGDNPGSCYYYEHGIFKCYGDLFLPYKVISLRCTGYRIIKEKTKGYLNIYPKNGSRLYNIKADANKFAAINRIACIEIEYYEGKGLE